VTYAITPIAGFPVAPAAAFPPVPVRVVNFTGVGFVCSRGTGEQSNVITIGGVGFVCSRGTGEQSNVITIGVSGGCQPYFLDTFTGTAGTPIESHTPDIAPAGFVWGQFSAESTQLDGAGSFTTTGVNTLAAGSAIGFTAPNLGTKFAVTFVSRMPG